MKEGKKVGALGGRGELKKKKCCKEKDGKEF